VAPDNKLRLQPAGNLPINEEIQIRSIVDSVERTFLPIGTTIGKYRILEEIDRGGMAVVYKAVQMDLDRIVALKVLPANITINRRFVERFLSEAHAVARLTHPNIVTIHEVSMENNIYFLAMDYLPGTNLYHYMNQKKPKVMDVVAIFIQIADALSYAHGRKILHRDLKLNNVIMRDNHIPVLIDFGLAKVLESDDDKLTRTGEILGSPAYMAPERILGSAKDDARSDICSLGIMLYEMLTLKNPYLDPRSIQQTTLNVIEASPVPPRKLVPWLSTEMEAITLKAMHREPSERYFNMAELRDDLIRYQRGEHVIASPPSIISRIFHLFRKYRLSFSVLTVILIFGGLLTAVLLRQSGREKSRWCSIFEDNFDTTINQSEWTAFPGTDSISSSMWDVRDNEICAATESLSFLRLERPFTRDARFEFDMHIGDGLFHDAGFFICGNTPDSGYCFHIHSGESENNGISLPGSRFIFSEYDHTLFPASLSYRVVIEKYDNMLTLKLNGFEICRLYDHFMPLGPNHRKSGFFVKNGKVRFDNIRILRRAVPELARPTIIADRLVESGDINGALVEYDEVLLDISRLDIVRIARKGKARCLIRSGDLNAARKLLDAELPASGRSADYMAQILYLQGMTEFLEGNREQADRKFAELAEHFPLNPLNNSAAATLMTNAIDGISRDSIFLIEDRIVSLASRYPEFGSHLGSAHLEILAGYVERAMTEQARIATRKIDLLYAEYPDIKAGSKLIMARLYLGKRQKSEAINLLNEAIALHSKAPNIWKAWLLMGEIYEYERNFGDANTMYDKVALECPQTMQTSWEARVRQGELNIMMSISDSAAACFKNVIESRHPFTLQRTTALFYRHELDSTTFRDRYLAGSGDSVSMLFITAKRAMADSDTRTALELLDRHINNLAPGTWEYLKAYTLKQWISR
jgi:serine/threonine protein kinase/tetratricopeptide (TPR) repeat protein